MIIALVFGVIAQAVLGLFILDHNDVISGPLQVLVSDEWAKYFGKLHRLGFKLIIGLIIIHVTANSLYGLLKKDPLIKAMVTGKKPAAEYEDELEAAIVPYVMRRAALCLFAACVIVLGGISLVGGSL